MTLEELLKAKGLTDDQIKAILDGMKENKIFTASEENLDIRYGKLKTDYDNLTTQNGEATKLIEQLKKGTENSDELQGKITAYETQVETLTKQLNEERLESALKVALMGTKTDDVAYMAFKLKEGGDLELDDNGNIKGIDEKIAGLKTQFPTHFETTGDRGNGTTPLVNMTQEQNLKIWLMQSGCSTKTHRNRKVKNGELNGTFIKRHDRRRI